MNTLKIFPEVLSIVRSLFANVLIFLFKKDLNYWEDGRDRENNRISAKYDFEEAQDKCEKYELNSSEQFTKSWRMARKKLKEKGYILPSVCPYNFYNTLNDF